MIYPSIDKLLNIVDSKYMLVHVAAKRSKQMLEYYHYQLDKKEYVNKKPLGRALEEIEKGMADVKAGRVYSADAIGAEMKREFDKQNAL